MKKLLRFVSPLLIAGCLFMPGAAYGMPQATARAPQSNAAAKRPVKAAPSTQDIADAKSKGMVWVNLSTHVYHKEGSMYGTTKRGKFMTEDDAKKAGYRAANESGTARKKQASASPQKK